VHATGERVVNEGAPIRVSVFGNSVALLVSGERGAPRPYRTYATGLRDRAIGGRRVEVQVHARIWGLVRDAMGAWADPLANERPDVVVLHYGMAEAFPCITPRRLNDALLGKRRRGGPVRDRWWAQAKRLLITIHRLERWTDALLPWTWGRGSTSQFEHDLRHLCRQIDRQIGAAIVFMDTLPPTRVVPFASPNMARRVAANNAAIRRVADEVGASVVSLADAVAGYDREVALPDGLHLSVDAHRTVADALAQVIGERCGVNASVASLA
jgi:lysophospholipase L1-like esterase